MRTKRYPAWYKVGTSLQGDVYWHPESGYALEIDHEDLATLDDLPEEWYSNAGNLDMLDRTVNKHQRLLRSLGAWVYRQAHGVIQEEEEFAAECEQEKTDTLRQGSGVY